MFFMRRKRSGRSRCFLCDESEAAEANVFYATKAKRQEQMFFMRRKRSDRSKCFLCDESEAAEANVFLCDESEAAEANILWEANILCVENVVTGTNSFLYRKRSNRYKGSSQ